MHSFIKSSSQFCLTCSHTTNWLTKSPDTRLVTSTDGDVKDRN